jgi:hypothetical protein
MDSSTRFNPAQASENLLFRHQATPIRRSVSPLSDDMCLLLQWRMTGQPSVIG